MIDPSIRRYRGWLLFGAAAVLVAGLGRVFLRFSAPPDAEGWLRVQADGAGDPSIPPNERLSN